MNRYYPHLLSPLVIRGHVLKNRMAMSRAVPTFAAGSDDYYPLDSLVTFAGNMAKNGAAIVTCPLPQLAKSPQPSFPSGASSHDSGFR